MEQAFYLPTATDERAALETFQWIGLDPEDILLNPCILWDYLTPENESL